MRTERNRAGVFLAILTGDKCPELRPLAAKIVRTAWTRTNTIAACARRLGVSRMTIYRLRDAHPELFT